jgi:hypothetical protein
VFTVGYEPLAFTDGEATFADAACPRTADSGDTVTIDGDCTDSDDVRWTGTATITRVGATGRDIVLDGYGNDAFVGAERATGTFSVRAAGDGRHSFAVDVIKRGGVTTTIEYSGTVEGDYDGPTLWNGSGTITRDGDFVNGGTVEATTVDQLRDNAICPGEGISGSTILRSADHDVVIEYDGATDCDDADAARWSRDGKDQGTIGGITCSTGGASGLGAIVLVVLVTLRRRGVRAPC